MLRTLLLFCFVAFIYGFGVSSYPKLMTIQSSKHRLLSMEYIPDGLSKKQWEELKKKEAEDLKKKDLGKVGITKFQSRSFEAWQNDLASLRVNDANAWISYCICSALSDDLVECSTALKHLTTLIANASADVRFCYCKALLFEKRKDLQTALDGYVKALQLCTSTVKFEDQEKKTQPSISSSNSMTEHPHDAVVDNGSAAPISTHNTIKRYDTLSIISEDKKHNIQLYLKEMKGEIMLRMAIIKKAMGLLDQSLALCNNILDDSFGPGIVGNAMCVKGLLSEQAGDFSTAEGLYRLALQNIPSHTVALERLGRIYLRYRETIHAAVQCFFKIVEINPSSSVAWYLLGRCYMATAQYSESCEAFNRAVNLDPNDPQIWCSLGVLYYAYGQYKEALGMLARALKLDDSMADAWYNVGALYDICDQPDDAQQAYQKARDCGVTATFTKAGLRTSPIAGPIATESKPSRDMTSQSMERRENTNPSKLASYASTDYQPRFDSHKSPFSLTYNHFVGTDLAESTETNAINHPSTSTSMSVSSSSSMDKRHE